MRRMQELDFLDERDDGEALAETVESIASRDPEWEKWLPSYSWTGFALPPAERVAGYSHRRLRRAVRTIHSETGLTNVWLDDVDPWRDQSGTHCELVVAASDEEEVIPLVRAVLESWMNPQATEAEALSKIELILGRSVPRAATVFVNKDAYYFRSEYEGSRRIWSEALKAELQAWTELAPCLRGDGVPMQPDGADIAGWYSELARKAILISQHPPISHRLMTLGWIETRLIPANEDEVAHLMIRGNLCAEFVSTVQRLVAEWSRKEMSAEEMSKVVERMLERG